MYQTNAHFNFIFRYHDFKKNEEYKVIEVNRKIYGAFGFFLPRCGTCGDNANGGKLPRLSFMFLF